MKIERSMIDTVELARLGKENMTKMLKSNPKVAYFRDNKVEIQARYVDEAGLYLSSFSVYPKEY